MEAMERLAGQVAGVELVLVGQGPQEGAVAEAAEEVNRRLGRRAVLALGGRGDVERVLPLGDVAVGTATVALEGMACGRPLVAAGKAGYLGVVGPESLERAEESCFGDHGRLDPVTPERLAADVGELLADREEAGRLGEFGRRTAESRYSVSRLAEEVEGIYRGALCEREGVGRIVVFHLNQIGDLVFALPALKALREAFPEAHITSVLRPYLAGLVEHSGFVDEIVHRPTGGPWRAAGLGLRLRGARPDVAVVFSQSATMALCARLSGARHRVGYVDSDLSRLLNHRIQVRGIPCPEKVMRLLAGLGLEAEKRDYVGLIRVSEGDEEAGERKLAECGMQGDGPVVALAPGEAGGRPYKSWSAEGLREVARRLAEEERARLVMVGSGKDRALGDEIMSQVAAGQQCNLAGRTTPAELAAVLARCDMLIGIDSGPMHVAAAMGRPVVGLFGPTDPYRTGPQGEGHEVIFHRQECWGPCVHPVTPKCVERRCMSAITVDEVLDAARRILARQAQSVEGG
jgi:lipopolysaccharide heptosyltransferase II